MGQQQAAVRDYRAGGLCDAQGAPLVAELEAANLLLAKFLGFTSAGTEGVWADEHLEMLQQGETQLPPMLDALEATWKTLPSCSHEEAETLATLTRQGAELGRQTRQRLQEAPYLRAYAEFRRELASWNEGQVSRREAARASACARKTRPPVPYFAWENEKGAQTFEFCDGTRVDRAVGGSPQLTPPARPTKKKVKPSEPAAYLAAINSFAAEKIERAPRAPKRTQPRSTGENKASNLGFGEEF